MLSFDNKAFNFKHPPQVLKLVTHELSSVILPWSGTMSLFSHGEGGTEELSPQEAKAFKFADGSEKHSCHGFSGVGGFRFPACLSHTQPSALFQRHTARGMQSWGPNAGTGVEGITLFSQAIIHFYPKFESWLAHLLAQTGVYIAKNTHENTLSWRMESHTKKKMASYLGHLLQQRLRCGYPPCHPPGNNTTITEGLGREDRVCVVAGDEE